MRNASLHTKKIKQLFTRLKKAGDKTTLVELETVMEYLLLAILSNYGSETRAAAAITRLLGAFVDYNDLRVTPIAEIVDVIGSDYPKCRKAAEEISTALRAIFNQLHHLNLDFLKVGSRKTAETFIATLGGISPHTKALVIARCLGGHAIPLDEHMYAYLINDECIPEATPIEDAQKFLAVKIKERDAETFYSLFKRFAATHGPRKLPTPKMPSSQTQSDSAAETKEPPEAEPATETKAASKKKRTLKQKAGSTAKASSVRKKSAAKKRASAKKKTAAKKTASKKATSCKTAAKKRTAKAAKKRSRTSRK